MLFFLSCTKVSPPVTVTPEGDDGFELQENDETTMWIDNTNAGAKGHFGEVKVFATGLNNPRGLKFSPTGRLYVAEGGDGATIGVCDQVPFPVGPYHGGTTGGRISRINWRGRELPFQTNSLRPCQ